MRKWDDEKDPLVLLTPEEFAQIPPGVTLTSISGTKAVKGVDEIDLDVRYGHIAFGFFESEIRISTSPDVAKNFVPGV